MTKGMTDVLIICQLCLFVMGGQYVHTMFVLQAVDMYLFIPSAFAKMVCKVSLFYNAAISFLMGVFFFFFFFF